MGVCVSLACSRQLLSWHRIPPSSFHLCHTVDYWPLMNALLISIQVGHRKARNHLQTWTYYYKLLLCTLHALLSFCLFGILRKLSKCQFLFQDVVFWVNCLLNEHVSFHDIADLQLKAQTCDIGSCKNKTVTPARLYSMTEVCGLHTLQTRITNIGRRMYTQQWV